MTTISHVRGCQPETMNAYGDGLLAANRTFTEQIDGMRSAVDNTMLHWKGSAASAASGRAWSEQVAATQMDDAVTAVADHYKTFGTQLSGIKGSLLDIVDKEVPAAGMTVADDGKVTAPKAPLTGKLLDQFVLQQMLDMQAESLQSRIKENLSSFGDTEGKASQAILGGANDLMALKRHPDSPTPHPFGVEPGQSGGPEYVLGEATKPQYNFTDDFEYGSKQPTEQDYRDSTKWQAMLKGAEVLKPELDDATDMYSHYWDNTGTPKEFDYTEAYREDQGVKMSVDSEVARAAAAADQMVRDGHTNFSITGDTRTVGSNDPALPYPKTEDWQKTIGAYQQWSHGNVRVEGNRVFMDVTVEAQDRYNFNKGAADIATGQPDNANGRFAELGWAKPFDTHGSITKTISWELGQPPQSGTMTDVSIPQRDPGGEDRIDNRNASGPMWPKR